MVRQIVTDLGIHNLTRAFPGHSAGDRANHSTCRHANRTGGSSTRDRARRGARASTHTGRQVMFGHVISRFRIHHFAGASACHATGNGTDGRTRSHSHRPADGADRRPGKGPGRRTGAARQVVIFELVGGSGLSTSAAPSPAIAPAAAPIAAPAAKPTGPATAPPIAAPLTAPPLPPIPVPT